MKTTRAERRERRIQWRRNLMSQIANHPEKKKVALILAGGLAAALLLFTLVSIFSGGLFSRPTIPNLHASRGIEVPHPTSSEPSQFSGIKPGGAEPTRVADGAPKGVAPVGDILFYPPADRLNPIEFATWATQALGTSPTQHALPVKRIIDEWNKYLTNPETSRMDNYDPRFGENFLQLLYLGEDQTTSINVESAELVNEEDMKELRQYWGKQIWLDHFLPAELQSSLKVVKVKYEALQDDAQFANMMQKIVDENEIYLYIACPRIKDEQVCFVETGHQSQAGKALSQKYQPRHNR